MYLNLKTIVIKKIKFSKVKDSKNKIFTVRIFAMGTEQGSAPTIWLGETKDKEVTTLNGSVINGNIKVTSSHRFVSYTKLLMFIFLDILIIAYMFLAFRIGIASTNNYIYKYRYALLTIVFVFGVSLKLNLSSISIWDNYVESEKLNPYEETLIAGKARAIRSDEWLVQTPMYFSQALSNDKFAVHNNNLSSEGTNMVLSAYSPVKDILVIGKPFNWGFLILGPEYGFSFYWLSKILLLFIFSFEISMILTNKDKKISLFGALFLTFASAMQWWMSTGVVDLIVFTQIIIVNLNWYMESKKITYKMLCSLGIIIGGVGFIFNLYPPLQVPLGILTLIFMFYIFKLNDNYKKLKKVDFIIIFSVIAMLGVSVLHFYKISVKDINLIQNTVYPGKRISVGGGVPVKELLYYMFSWFMPFRDITTFSNNSEASSFFTLFPFIPFVFLFIEDSFIKKQNLLRYLLYFSGFQLAWFFIIFPEWFTKLTFLSYVDPKRLLIVFGLTSVYILIIFMANLKKIRFKCSVYKVLAIFNMFLFLFSYKSDIHLYLGKKFAILTVIYINLIIYSIIKNNKKTAVTLMLIIVTIPGIMVNPIIKGAGPIYNKDISYKIRSLNSSDPGTWLGTDNMTFGNFLAANGVQVFNCVNYTPDFAKWNRIDPANKYEDVYNRYAHIGVNMTYDKTTFILNGPDHFTVVLNYEDLLYNTNVDYIMTKTTIDPKNKYKAFEKIYYDEVGNNYIYKVNR